MYIPFLIQPPTPNTMGTELKLNRLDEYHYSTQNSTPISGLLDTFHLTSSLAHLILKLWNFNLTGIKGVIVHLNDTESMDSTIEWANLDVSPSHNPHFYSEDIWKSTEPAFNSAIPKSMD